MAPSAILSLEQLPHLQTLSECTSDELLDLICVGFGPASLAIAIALHDSRQSQKVLFMEKQPQFNWHAGMQLPGAKMQISFLKDLATPRDPTSHFTFLNYLLEKGRLHHFINLGTFLPARAEYEDYLRWCASHFERKGDVLYGIEVKRVQAGQKNGNGEVTNFVVTSRDQNGELVMRRARKVVIAVGGRPIIPPVLQRLKHVHHSSQFAHNIGAIQEREAGRSLKFAVVGSGQSAAELFNDLWDRFPTSEIKLLIKGASLRASDDSPFVNEIFNPDRVSSIFSQNPVSRSQAIALDKATNYGVVRLSLLEHLHEKLYLQRLHTPSETQWRCRIISDCIVASASQLEKSSIRMGIHTSQSADNVPEKLKAQCLDVDYIFAATGYKRDAHEEMLADIQELLPTNSKISVGRNYGVLFKDGKIASGVGIWLQGCNEATHGLSDTLLSILAVRGGELVESMFGHEGEVKYQPVDPSSRDIVDVK